MVYRSRFSYLPSLVPLADMLTNTVGIVIFILIFVVLVAGGASDLRLMPYEHAAASKRPIYLICSHDELYPDELRQLFRDNYVKGDRISITTDPIKANGMEMRGQLSFQGGPSFLVSYRPIENEGTPVKLIARNNKKLLEMIKKYEPNVAYPFFFVYPDSVPCFAATRTLWQQEGYSYGWQPEGTNSVVGICYVGDCGGDLHGATVQ